MKIKFNKYLDGSTNITLFWDNQFEESVMEAIFDYKIKASMCANCIILEKMEDELVKLIKGYHRKVEKKELKQTLSKVKHHNVQNKDKTVGCNVQ